MTTDLTHHTQASGAGPTAPGHAHHPGFRAAAEHLLNAVRLADQQAAAKRESAPLSAWANIAQRINLAAAGVLLHVDERETPVKEDDCATADVAAALQAAAQQLAAVPLDAGLGVVGTAEVLFQISRAQLEVQQLRDATALTGEDGPEPVGPAR